MAHIKVSKVFIVTATPAKVAKTSIFPMDVTAHRKIKALLNYEHSRAMIVKTQAKTYFKTPEWLEPIGKTPYGVGKGKSNSGEIYIRFLSLAYEQEYYVDNATGCIIPHDTILPLLPPRGAGPLYGQAKPVYVTVKLSNVKGMTACK